MMKSVKEECRLQKRIARIKEMERIFDRLQEAGAVYVGADPDLSAQFAMLIEYYESPQWRDDYEADERGELPQDLKRGVLSQDGIYNFLCEIEESRKEKGEHTMDNAYIVFMEDEEQPYSDIVVVDDKFLFLAGLVSEDLETRDEAYGTIEFETNRILDNLKIILEKYGSDMDHVVKIDVLVSKWEYKDAMNREYVKHFKKNRLPARICYGDVAIAGECKVEMAVVATKK